MEYDDIIIGAGSSGAVLAARLSEDAGRSVLLLEAGPDYATPEALPADLADGMHLSLEAHDWGLRADALPGRPIKFPRGRVTGGSSAVNGAIALRGAPADYDEWAALGNDGWGWADVLPDFRRLEDDQDIHDDLHGAGGPIAVRRWREAELLPAQRAFGAICRRLGFEAVSDHNHPEASGVGPVPQNLRGRLRLSTALGYLLPARPRLNLTIRGDCLVHRVLFAGQRAIGVEVESGGVVQRVYGGRVTLCAGAIASPAILLRSGIGPKADLLALGIEPLVDAPGVGANLIDHPATRLLCVPKDGVVAPDDPFVQLLLRYTVPGSDVFNDMQLVMLSHIDIVGLAGARAAAAVGAPLVFGMAIALQRPNARGRLSLASADPHTPPTIDLNYLSDPEDTRRLMEGVRLAWQIATAPEMAPYVERVALLDAATVASDEALAAYVQATVTTLFHPVGTAKMGPAHDPLAVVDDRCRVRGVEGLRVVDASIMPTIPRANTNLTCIMIGERVAGWLRQA